MVVTVVNVCVTWIALGACCVVVDCIFLQATVAIAGFGCGTTRETAAIEAGTTHCCGTGTVLLITESLLGFACG